MASREVPVNAKLFVVDGTLTRITFSSEENVGRQLLRDIMDDKVHGLPYCEETTVCPTSYGGFGNDGTCFVMEVR